MIVTNISEAYKLDGWIHLVAENSDLHVVHHITSINLFVVVNVNVIFT
jgi:hypothetical protein